MLRICTEPVSVGASLVGTHATPRLQPAESDEGNHKGRNVSELAQSAHRP